MTNSDVDTVTGEIRLKISSFFFRVSEVFKNVS